MAPSKSKIPVLPEYALWFVLGKNMTWSYSESVDMDEATRVECDGLSRPRRLSAL